MVKYSLKVCVESTGISSMHLPQPFEFSVKVRKSLSKLECDSCHEQWPNWISFSAEENVSSSNTKGEFHLVVRCSECKKEGTAAVLDSCHEIGGLEDGRCEKVWASLDFRGVKPIDWQLAVIDFFI